MFVSEWVLVGRGDWALRGVLSVDNILEDVVHLALKLELSSGSKIETRGVDDGKQDPVKTRLADLNAGHLDGLHALRGTVQEAAEGCLLVDGHGRRNVRRFEQQPKQGGFAHTQTTHDLDTDSPNTQ